MIFEMQMSSRKSFRVAQKKSEWSALWTLNSMTSWLDDISKGFLPLQLQWLPQLSYNASTC